MKLVLKIVLAGVILTVLGIGGCAVLLGGAATQITQQDNRHSMTKAEFSSVKLGTTYKELVSKYGQPDPSKTQQIETGGLNDLTVYYNVAGGGPLDLYQFDFQNGRLATKGKF